VADPAGSGHWVGELTHWVACWTHSVISAGQVVTVRGHSVDFCGHSVGICGRKVGPQSLVGSDGHSVCLIGHWVATGAVGQTVASPAGHSVGTFGQAVGAVGQ